VLFPHTVSRRIVLNPASVADQKKFTGVLLRTSTESFRPTPRPNGSSPAQASAAFTVTRRNTGDYLGFSMLYGLDPAGHIRYGLHLDPEKAKLGVGSEAIILSINYAFAMFPVDKVINQTTQATFGSLGMGEGSQGAEGIFREHLYFRGKSWDMHSFQISREGWGRVVDELADILDPPLSWRSTPGETYRAPEVGR